MNFVQLYRTSGRAVLVGGGRSHSLNPCHHKPSRPPRGQSRRLRRYLPASRQWHAQDYHERCLQRNVSTSPASDDGATVANTSQTRPGCYGRISTAPSAPRVVSMTASSVPRGRRVPRLGVVATCDVWRERTAPLASIAARFRGRHARSRLKHRYAMSYSVASMGFSSSDPHKPSDPINRLESRA